MTHRRHQTCNALGDASLALQAKAQWQDNGRPLRRLREAFQPALVLLLFNILASLFFIAQILGSY